MRHGWIALGMICFSVVAAAAQTAMPKPGPEHKRLQVFAGNWTFEGQFRGGTIGQGGKITGTETNQVPGGFFVERHYKEKGPAGERRGVHVFGYDPVKKTYVTSDFDSMGGYGSGTASVSGNTWTFSERQTAPQPMRPEIRRWKQVLHGEVQSVDGREGLGSRLRGQVDQDQIKALRPGTRPQW